VDTADIGASCAWTAGAMVSNADGVVEHSFERAF
jgi:hypothetical protein